MFRHWILFWVIASVVGFCPGQEIRLADEEVLKLPEFGSLKLSDEAEQSLKIPAGFMGDEILGKLVLLNDSTSAAQIGKIQTSCGCTSAIPMETMIGAGKQGIMLITYQPKMAGKSRLETLLTFGEKQFHLSGIAETKSKLQATQPQLAFGKDGRTTISIDKLAHAPVDRLDLLPSSISVKDFVDGDNLITATLVHSSNNRPDRVTVYPMQGDRLIQKLDYSLRYVGFVEALPRRLFASEEPLRFYLRGDVESLKDATHLKIHEGETVREVPCEVKLQGSVLSVSMRATFDPGDHPILVEMNDVEFPISIFVR